MYNFPKTAEKASEIKSAAPAPFVLGSQEEETVWKSREFLIRYGDHFNEGIIDHLRTSIWKAVYFRTFYHFVTTTILLPTLWAKPIAKMRFSSSPTVLYTTIRLGCPTHPWPNLWLSVTVNLLLCARFPVSIFQNSNCLLVTLEERQGHLSVASIGSIFTNSSYPLSWLSMARTAEGYLRNRMMAFWFPGSLVPN